MKPEVQDCWKAFCLAPGEETFACFYEQTKGFIYTIAYRILQDEEEASDVLQGVYAQLVTIANTPEEANQVTDIDELVRRLTLRDSDTLRKRRARRSQREVPFEHLELMEGESPDALSLASDKQVREQVERILATLPDSQRLPVVFYYFHGMTHQEIAEVLGYSRAHVTKLIDKALKKLEPRMKQAGLDSALTVLLAIFAAAKLRQPPAALKAEVVYSNASSLLKAPAAAAKAANTVATSILKAKTLATAATGAVVVLGVLGTLFHLFSSTPIEGQSRPAAPATPATVVESQKVAQPSSTPEAPALSVPAAPPPLSRVSNVAHGRLIEIYRRQAVAGVNLRLAPGTTTQALSLAPQSILQTKSDPAGLFSFTPPAPGEYMLAVEPEAPWVGLTQRVTVKPGEPLDLGDIELNRRGTVSGRFVRASDGTGIPGIRVQIQNSLNQDWPVATSDAQGRFLFTDLSWYRYSLQVSQDPGFIVRQVELNDSESMQVTIPIGEAILNGQVYRAGKPQTAKFVITQQKEGTNQLAFLKSTNYEGAYKVLNLAPGKWRVEVCPYELPLRKQKVVAYVDIPASGTVTRNFDLPSGRLVGQVVDNQNRPLSGARVTATTVLAASQAGSQTVPDTAETTSGSDGKFAFEGLPPADYVLYGSYAGVGADKETTCALPQQGDSSPALLTVACQTGGSLVSLALNMSTGAPLPEAWCTITSEHGSFDHGCRRDKQGVLRVENLPPGRYRVQVSATGFSLSEHTIEIRPGETQNIQDVLYEAGALRWTLEEPTSGPLQGISCQLTPDDPASIEEPRQGKTDPEGTWICRGLLPGNYTAVAQIGGKRVRQSVTIHAHDMTEIRTRVTPEENRPQ